MKKFIKLIPHALVGLLFGKAFGYILGMILFSPEAQELNTPLWSYTNDFDSNFNF